MAAAFDAVSKNLNSGGTAISFTHTPVGTPSLVIASFHVRNDTSGVVGTPTYGGTNMSLAKAQADGTNNQEVEVWYLTNPAAGAQTLAATCDVNTRTYCTTYTGTLLVAPLGGTAGDDDAESVDITPTEDNALIYGAIMTENDNVPTASGETAISADDEGFWANACSYTVQGAAATQTVNWTGPTSQSTVVAAWFKAAASTDHTISKSENITVTESLASYSDTIFVRESVRVEFGAGNDLSVNVSDSITVTESVQRVLESFVNKSESITITESVNVYLPVYNLSVSDNITVSESTKTELLSFINKSEDITITESIQRVVESYINKSESITVSENVVMGFPGPINVSDTITVSESVTVVIADPNLPQAIVSDSITITENVSVAISSPQVNVSDSVTVTEDSKAELNSFVSKSESITVTESVSVAIQAVATLSINTNDIITITESTNQTIVTPSAGGRNTRLMMGVGL